MVAPVDLDVLVTGLIEFVRKRVVLLTLRGAEPRGLVQSLAQLPIAHEHTAGQKQRRRSG